MLRLALFLRSFLVQGSFNYRNLIGTGMAWAFLPAQAELRREGKGGETELISASEPFNANPYLTPVALGALTRAARNDEDPERIRRFREAVRSPLGSLGDKLFWSSWRPFCLVAGALAAALGTGAEVVVGGVLILYNVLHIGLRAWGLSAGLRMGLDVGQALRRAALAEKAERIAALGVLVSGVLCGVLLRDVPELPGSVFLWILGGIVLLLAGVLRGEALRRLAPAFLLLIVIAGLTAHASSLLPGAE